MCKWYVLYLLSLLWRRSGGTLPLSVGKLTHLNARSRLSLWFEDRSRVTFPSKWRIACCIFSSAWNYLKVCSIAKNSEKNLCVVKIFSDIAYKVCNLQKTMRGFRDRSNTVAIISDDQRIDAYWRLDRRLTTFNHIRLALLIYHQLPTTNSFRIIQPPGLKRLRNCRLHFRRWLALQTVWLLQI